MASKSSQHTMRNLANALARKNPREIARKASPANRMYPGGPRGGPLPAQMSGPPMLPSGKPSDSPALTSADVHKIENAFGRSSPKGRAVLDALRSAGLLGGRRPGTPAPTGRGSDRGAMSPLGGQAS
jgi:hypothetical protein